LIDLIIKLINLLDDFFLFFKAKFLDSQKQIDFEGSSVIVFDDDLLIESFDFRKGVFNSMSCLTDDGAALFSHFLLLL